MAISIPRLLSISSLFVVGVANGQISAELQPYVHVIRGAESPDLVPKDEYIQTLVPHLDGVDLGNEDTEVLAAFQAEFRALAESTEAVVLAEIGDACREVVSVEVSVTADVFMKRISAAEAARDATLIRAYDQALQKLSPAGRAAVQAYLDSEIIPNMTVVKQDAEGLALAFPAGAAKLVEQQCIARSQESVKEAEGSSESISPVQGEAEEGAGSVQSSRITITN